MNTGVDLTDLLRGEGEWRNMQEIVRKTFKVCFDQIQHQNEQITKLVGKVRSLKEELASKPDTEEILKLISSKMPKPSRSGDDVDRLKTIVTSLRTDIERKASVSYVDDSLKRKVDKSDILMHNLSKITSSQYVGDINQLQNDIIELRTTLDITVEKSTQNYKEIKASYVGDMSLFKAQFAEIESKASQWTTKNEVQQLVDQKSSRVEVEGLLSRKADAANLEALSSRFEAALGEHEKLITALRLRGNEDSLRSGDTLLRGHPLTQPTYVRAGSALSEELLREEGDLGCLLKSGRVEAIVQGLWTKMNTVTLDSQRSTQDVINLKAQMLTVENSLKSCAGQHRVETLAAAFEEQRLRLDSVILGSTTIEPVSKQLKQFSADVSEIKSYLRLPQKKPLRDQLHEAGELIEVLSRSVTDLRSMVSRNATRLDVVEASSNQLDTRVRVVESHSHRLDQLARHTDLSETEHGSLRAVSADVSSLWGRLQAVAKEAKAECSRSCQLLSDRVEAVENEVVLSDVKHAKSLDELREAHRVVQAELMRQGERLSECDKLHKQGERRLEAVVDKVKEMRHKERTSSSRTGHPSSNPPPATSAVSKGPSSAHSSSGSFSRRAAAAAHSPTPPVVIFSDSESFDSHNASIADITAAAAASVLGISGIASESLNDSRAVASSLADNKENLPQILVVAAGQQVKHSDASTTTSEARKSKSTTTTTSSAAGEGISQALGPDRTASRDRGRKEVVSVAVGAEPEQTVRMRAKTDTASGPSSSSAGSGGGGGASSTGTTGAHHMDMSFDGINLPAALSLLETSKFVALTSVEKIDERLETLKAEREALKRRLLSTVEI